MLSLSSSLWSSRCLMVGPTATLQSSRFALIAGSLAARSPQELGDLRQIEQNHWERPTKNHCCCRWHKSLTVTYRWQKSPAIADDKGAAHGVTRTWPQISEHVIIKWSMGRPHRVGAAPPPVRLSRVEISEKDAQYHGCVYLFEKHLNDTSYLAFALELVSSSLTFKLP